jgi:putative YjhG/YagF family dehydratase
LNRLLTLVAALAPRQVEAASSLALPRPRKWWAKRSACRFLIPRWLRPAIPSGWTWRAGPLEPLLAIEQSGITMKQVLTEAALHNAMVVHAAFGGSTNLILHLPAVAHAAGLGRPSVEDWARINRQVPRLVDALPNGPRNHITVRVFLAGGVPEVLLHLRRAGLLETGALTVSGMTLGQQLDEWEKSERRKRLRAALHERDSVNPDDVILAPEDASRRGLTSTVCFPTGNLAPEGSLIKATSIDPSVIDADGVFRKIGPAKVFTTEASAIAAVKDRRIREGDVLVLACRGPMGAGMEETYQLTSALRYLDFGKQVAIVTDARFSGVSTGACIGHVSPEALAGGPIGKLRDGDMVEIVVDRVGLEGSLNLGGNGVVSSSANGSQLLAGRETRPDLSVDSKLPDDTRLWAALRGVSGGTWGGAVYDVDSILRVLAAGQAALARK